MQQLGPRADAADRGAADRGPAAAARPAGPARPRRCVAAAGEPIFSNLGLLFAIGIAVGLARENHGAAGLAGVVCYLVATKGAEVLIAVPPDVVAALTGQHAISPRAYKARELAKLSVPVGILSGVIAGVLYNRYSEHQAAELPRVLRRPALRADRQRLRRASSSPRPSATAGRRSSTAWTR